MLITSKGQEAEPTPRTVGFVTQPSYSHVRVCSYQDVRVAKANIEFIFNSSQGLGNVGRTAFQPA
jgi:hypothetical protein